MEKNYVILLLFVAISFEGALGQAKIDVEFTPAQATAFETFKTAALKGKAKDSPFLTREVVLAKFFKANLFSPDLAGIALESTAAYRKRMNLDAIEGDPETDDLIRRIGGITGEHDKNGQPLFFFWGGKWGMRTSIHKGEIEKWKKAFTVIHDKAAQDAIKLFEAGIRSNATYGVYANYKGWTILEGACLECFPAIVDLSKEMEAHWPLFMSHITCVNTVKDFEQIVKLVKPILATKLRESFDVYGERKEWEDKVAKDLDPALMEKLFDDKNFPGVDAPAPSSIDIKPVKPVGDVKI